MHAAVVSSFDRPPRYEQFPAPTPSGNDDVLLTVLAAGLHPRVRSQANGSHYTSTGDLPLIPGIDGVGRAADGTMRYFILPDTNLGSMAEQVVVDNRRSVELPDDLDPVLVAAAMNPATSSWIALRRRIHFPPGQRVLVLGATGNAGSIAVQVAKRLGADHVIAAGRNRTKLSALPALGADSLVDLGGEPATVARALGEAGADVDVVIDYVWGQPTADALGAIIPARRDDGQPLTWIQIGSVAGATSPIPSAALRAARLQLVGSGQGAVSTGEILAELPALAQEVGAGRFRIDARAVPLTGVEQAWIDAATSPDRLVIVP